MSEKIQAAVMEWLQFDDRWKRLCKDEVSVLIKNYLMPAVYEAEERKGAEVLAACAAEILKRAGELRDLLKTIEESCGPGDVDVETERLRMENRAEELELVAAGIRNLQPAAKALEALLEQAHEAALPRAAVQLLKAITEGGDFAVGSPLAKVKQRVEELLREERQKVATRLRHIADGYEAGGHTHRARAFRAIADEFGR